MTHYHDRLEAGEFAAVAAEVDVPATDGDQGPKAYADMTVVELRQAASAAEILGRSAMDQAELVRALEDHDRSEEAAATGRGDND